ncbi:MAG: Phosphoribosylamine--glycine ligase [Candidatus Saccharibacteria bacterium]|nr:Phosphoribosylamine--glycine ligase [Candidatus Saccharibacteria bacterium]
MPVEDTVVLVVGSGGREHELVRQLAWTADIQKVYAIPGNAGTALLDIVENVDLSVTDVPAIVAFVHEHAVTTVLIGPEAPLLAGLSDALRAEGIVVFGASKAAAMLEASKAFAAGFMRRQGIPQPQYWTVHSLEEALEVIKERDPTTYVLKADGLAAGKGVVLPQTTYEAEEALQLMFSGEGFDAAGKDGVVIQERLHGPEVSAFAISDGTNVILLPFAQDHKRLLDNNEGPNTGGMGAYTPLPSYIVSEDQTARIHAIAAQSITGMANEGNPYQGVLYIGLILAEERGGAPVVIEYNARFGDPEAEVLLPALSESDVDVAHLLIQTAHGTLPAIHPSFKTSVLTVCLAASGYPQTPRKGDLIEGLENTYENVIIHHAGTKKVDDTTLTNGGRVLYVTGFGPTLDEAAAHAYAAIGENAIHFEGMQYRTDIGYQGRTPNTTVV